MQLVHISKACNRLRELGHVQSVVFCAPLEVRSKLLECSGKKDASLLDVEDVLFWTMRNSWEFAKKGMPLWATQVSIRHSSCFPSRCAGTSVLRPFFINEELYALGYNCTEDFNRVSDIIADALHAITLAWCLGSIGIFEPEALTLDESYGLDRVSAEEAIVCRNRIQAETDLARTELSSIRVSVDSLG